MLKNYKQLQFSAHVRSYEKRVTVEKPLYAIVRNPKE